MLKWTALILGGTVATAATQAHPFDSLDGAYTGFRVDAKSSQAQSVSAFASWSGAVVAIRILDNASKKAVLALELTELRRDRARGSADPAFSKELGSDPLDLSLTEDDCLSDPDSRLRVCVGEKSASFQVAGARYDLVAPGSAEDPSNEMPRDYTVEDLRNRSSQMNFNSLVEFEHVTQARALARNSKMNLLPHLSANSLIALGTGDSAGILGAIGDLVPFLLPNRWMQKAENRERSAAELDAYEAMQADIAFQTEGMALSLARDAQVLSSLQDSVQKIAAIRDELAFRERMGQFPPGIHDDASSLIIQAQKAASVLRESIQEQYTYLAQSAGFHRPDAIRSIIPVKPEAREPILPVSDAGRLARIVDRSAELRQLDHLIQAARANRKGRWFAWTDPSGDPAGGLGFGLGSYVAIGTSQVREMQLRREQQESFLAARLRIVIAQINLQADLYQQTESERVVQESRVNRMLTNIHMGASFALSDLMSSLQDHVRNQIDQVSASYNYWVARAALARLEREGAYQSKP